MYIAKQCWSIVVSPITGPPLSQLPSLLQGGLTSPQNCVKSLPGGQALTVASTAFSLFLCPEFTREILILWGSSFFSVV